MDEQIVSNIKMTLSEIQQNEGIEILYAIESGSRGWGFPSIDSDYDCRFIYRQQLEAYISIGEIKDYIELPVDEIYDVNGWDLRKILIHIQKSNPTVWEWLQSPVTYYTNKIFKEECLALAKQYYDEKTALYHYRSLAKKKLEQIEKEGGKLKAYFYALRSVLACEYIILHHHIPPMTLKELMEKVSLNEKMIQEINRLVVLKKSVGEGYKLEKNGQLLNYMEQRIEHCETYITTLEKRKGQSCDLLNEFFRKWIIR